MKKYKELGVYDFSDYAEEITGDALFKVNGGAEVENSHEGVAGANVGDTITRKDGTVVTLKQADIDYAQKQLGDTGNKYVDTTIGILASTYNLIGQGLNVVSNGICAGIELTELVIDKLDDVIPSKLTASGSFKQDLDGLKLFEF